MNSYDHKKFEAKWQKIWQKNKLYSATDKSGKPKKYVLIEFPYPSGEGLHMGHLRPYAAGDVYSRYLRAKGYEVLYPIGWDAFGLPAENFAIKKGIQPSITTAQNIKNAKAQVISWGMSFDWSREINTTDPDYYKWTQWIFLQFFKKGLAYEAIGLINWCPKDKTGLANEEVIDGRCERCGTVVEKKEMKQWYLKITAYAEKLLQGLKSLDWPEQVKIQQANWIGKKEGALIKFAIANSKLSFEAFTTRPDTLFGATYMVLAPEHKLVQTLKEQIQNWPEVEKYIETAGKKTELQRTALEKDKTGVELKGVAAVNPASKEKIPIWIADYVLMNYGTGAIMAVPAHDQRDWEFAKKYHLPIREVIKPRASVAEKVEEEAMMQVGDVEIEKCWTGEGKLVNSGKYDGLKSEDARIRLVSDFGKSSVQYKLRDWVFSRQRYWGEPIPIIHCEKCGAVAVPEKDLPVKLPPVAKYEPTGSGQSPLAAMKTWVNVKCPNCAGPAKRETNTMPQWAGSSWYYLRYTDPRNRSALADQKLLQHWLPVDVYFGGMEHTTLHLLYSRFWHLFLRDEGIVPTDEPYSKRVPHGIILGPDGEKMSKSRGNIVSPDEVVNEFGADALRMYELFLGPHEATVAWKTKNIVGVERFLKRVANFEPNKGGDRAGIHKLIKKVGEDIELFKFNTAVAAFMEHYQNKNISERDWHIFLRLLAPFAPYLTEELWQRLGHKKSIHLEKWPEYDEQLVKEGLVAVAVQVNGKHRATIEIPPAATEAKARQAAEANENVSKYLDGKTVRKVVYVSGKVINFVT